MVSLTLGGVRNLPKDRFGFRRTFFVAFLFLSAVVIIVIAVVINETAEAININAVGIN